MSEVLGPEMEDKESCIIVANHDYIIHGIQISAQPRNGGPSTPNSLDGENWIHAKAATCLGHVVGRVPLHEPDTRTAVPPSHHIFF